MNRLNEGTHKMNSWHRFPGGGAAASVFLCAMLFGWISTSAGCAAGNHAAPRAQRVDLSDFAQPASGRRGAQTEQPSERGGAAERPSMTLGVVSSDVLEEEVGDIREVVRAQPASRLAPGEVYIVDSLVGQVHGRPIFADAFFAPIERQLIEERRRMGEIAFRERAAEIIGTHLWIQTGDILFLAEARATLTPEEQQGLFAFMRHLRERQIALGGGTRAGAEQRLQEREGMSIDEYVRAQRDDELVMKLLHEKIRPRVIVSWRDVQREYDRRRDEFNPPPTLHLSRIRVSNTDAETIERVSAALEAGEPFAQVAQSLGQGDGAWQEFNVSFGEDGLEEIELAETIKTHLLGKRVGESTGPIRLGTTTMWLHLARIDQEARSIYELDVQRRLMRELHHNRMREEEQRYINSLFRKGIYEELNVMVGRLLDIAMQRYGTPRP